MSQQGLRQASVRAVTGTALTYEGDFHALFTGAGIPVGEFNGRFLQWINAKLSATYADLPSAMQALAVSAGAYNFSSLGTFDASTSAPTEVPENTVAPSISAIATVGQVASGDNGSWDQPPILSTAYQHQISDTGVGAGTDIVGATTTSYTFISGQIGKYFRRGTKATNAVGPAVSFAYSAYVGPIVAAPAITGTPPTTGTVGAAYSATFGKSGGHGAGAWTLVGDVGASGLVADPATGDFTAAALGPAATYGPFSRYWTDADGIQSNTIGPWSIVVSGGGGGVAPSINTAPVVVSSGDVGQNATATNGTYFGTPTPTITGEWQLDGVGLGDVDLTFAITLAQSKATGGLLRWYETATNASGSVSQPSNTIQVFHPMQLSPHFFFDAEEVSSLVKPGDVVTSWTSIATDAVTLTQATGSFRPTWNATGLASRPCVQGDGIDDYLRNSALTGLWPATNVGSEIWATVNQPTAAATTGMRYFFSYGNVGGSTLRARSLYRNTVTGVNRFVADVGTSSANVAGVNSNVDFTGIHVLRGVFSSTAVQGDVDTNAGTGAAAVPSTISLQGGVLSRPLDTPGNFTAGSINWVGSFPITITSDNRTSLWRWAGARGGLSLLP